MTYFSRPTPMSSAAAGKASPANAGRRFAHPELANFPLLHGLRKIANKTHPGNILTRRAVVTARRIPRCEMAYGRLGAPGGRSVRVHVVFRCRSLPVLLCLVPLAYGCLAGPAPGTG